MSEVIRWEEPVAVGSERREPWIAVAEALREHPNQWALILDEPSWTGAQYVAGLIRVGDGPFAPRDAFEVKTRTVGAYDREIRGPKNVRVYARYVNGDNQ